jgi:hypothetical protein
MHCFSLTGRNVGEPEARTSICKGSYGSRKVSIAREAENNEKTRRKRGKRRRRRSGMRWGVLYASNINELDGAVHWGVREVSALVRSV